MDEGYEPEWTLLEEVFNSDEAQLIGGLLSMARIPVRIDRDTAAELYGLTIGPLAKIRIMVPGGQLLDARQILAGEISDYEEE